MGLSQRSWETQEGERRSKVEITAEIVAPSLRYATAVVSKVERDRQPDSGSSAPAQAVPAGGVEYNPDDEPF